MRNPFDLQRRDTEFAKSAATKRGRRVRIKRLSAERPWALVSLLVLGLMVAVFSALESTDISDLALPSLMFATIVGYLVHLDLQIKFLLALEASANAATSGDNSTV